MTENATEPEVAAKPAESDAVAEAKARPTGAGAVDAAEEHLGDGNEAQPENNGAAGNGAGLWHGDTGTLQEKTRRVLLELLKGPYVSGAQTPGLWSALIADEASVRSRLNDLFLDLVIDKVDEFAFTRKVVTDEIDVPAAIRSERLTFLDTAMLLVLRQMLLEAPGERRVIIDQEEVYERLAIYRRGDETIFIRNLNGSWGRMGNRLRVLHKAGQGRFEISPMVRFLVDEDQVRELIAVYHRIAAGEGGDGATDDETVAAEPGGRLGEGDDTADTTTGATAGEDDR